MGGFGLCASRKPHRRVRRKGTKDLTSEQQSGVDDFGISCCSSRQVKNIPPTSAEQTFEK